jgi:hypothetical protein
MNNKSDLKARIKTLLTDSMIVNRIVKFIRCDDAGENITIKMIQRSKHLVLNLSFWALEPLKNGKIERKFQILYGRIRALLNGAGLEDELRDKIWVECVMNVMYLSKIISTKSSFKSPFESSFSSRKTKLEKLFLPTTN